METEVRIEVDEITNPDLVSFKIGYDGKEITFSVPRTMIDDESFDLSDYVKEQIEGEITNSQLEGTNNEEGI